MRALRLAQFESRAWQQLAVCAAKEERTGEAFRFFLGSLSLNAREMSAYLNLANLLERSSQPEAAIDVIRRALVVSPHNEAVQSRAAYLIWNHRGDREGALFLLRAVLREVPDDPLALALMRELENKT